MAMAYGALANGGVLMQPQIIRELRASDGSVVERFEPREIRRVIGEDVAGQVGRALVDVVEDGTGTLARLGSFEVAGKSGTAWFASRDGYEDGAYSSSFVGYFPADDPQLVVFVKLDRPQGQYYGGAVAAPVTRATMEAALAASEGHLDRGQLMESLREGRLSAPPPELTATLVAQPIDPPAPPFMGGFAVDPTAAQQVGPSGVSLPDVSGLPARVAVRRLHALGFELIATRGTAAAVVAAGVPCALVNKVQEGRPHVVDRLKNGDIHLIVNTTEGKQAIADSFTIRRSAIQNKVPYATTMAFARAVATALERADVTEVNRLQDLHEELGA